MLGYAARYGHQQVMRLIDDPTLVDFQNFCDAVHFWVRSENEKGTSMTNRLAEGGG